MQIYNYHSSNGTEYIQDPKSVISYGGLLNLKHIISICDSESN